MNNSEIIRKRDFYLLPTGEAQSWNSVMQLVIETILEMGFDQNAKGNEVKSKIDETMWFFSLSNRKMSFNQFNLVRERKWWNWRQKSCEYNLAKRGII